MGCSSSATVKYKSLSEDGEGELNNHDPLTPKGVPQKGVHACDVRGPVDRMFQDMSNANAHLAQVSMPIIKTGFALAYRTGVNKGPGFWFAVFVSLCFPVE